MQKLIQIFKDFFYVIKTITTFLDEITKAAYYIIAKIIIEFLKSIF